MTALFIFLGLIVLIGLYVMMTYNKFVKLKVNVEEAWSDIEVQMKRRYNLIPNLVTTVKGYAKHEKGTFEAVTKARNMAMNATGGAKSQGKAEGMFASALKSLFAVAEAYPELKLSHQRRVGDNNVISFKIFNQTGGIFGTCHRA